MIQAQALYRDRMRLANAALLFVIGGMFYMAYGSTVQPLITVPSFVSSDGWVQSIQYIYSYNTLAFVFVVLVMVLLHTYWTWAFLPSPATLFILNVLRGIFGGSINIARHIGGRFRVWFTRDAYLDIFCHVHDHRSDGWFTFLLRSSPVTGKDVEEVALRHGLSYSHKRLTTHATNEELYGRTLLLARAMLMLNIISP